jgi:hypothetical protein
MLIAVVKRFVGAFDEDLAPLDETRGGEPGQGAENDLLEKRSLHSRSKQHVKCHRYASPLPILARIHTDRTAAHPSERRLTKIPTGECA